MIKTKVQYQELIDSGIVKDQIKKKQMEEMID